jgi:hypothetical protein
MRAEDLVGTWSNDAQYGPGAQSDEQLHFRVDGIGCVEYASGAGATARSSAGSFAPTGSP